MVDIAKVIVSSGRGGNGSASYRREKFVPKGGPDGGDGGDGGNVFLVAAAELNTLRDYAGSKLWQAENGGDGGKRQMFGKKGADRELRVPVGTVVWELLDDQKHWLGELTTAGERLLVARGGQGGRGNVHFKSSTNTTPMEYEQGGAAQVRTLLLEMKLIADIGLVGMPNAGKSTLLSVITKAQPKIAEYPFTTLEPNLGVLELGADGDRTRYVVADIPGLIEAASEGKGLGHQFLRHVERCRALVFVLAPDPYIWDSTHSAEEKSASLRAQWDIVLGELEKYQPQLAQRARLVVVNKADLLSPADQALARSIALDLAVGGRRPGPQGEGPAFLISAATRMGITEFLAGVQTLMQDPRTQTPSLLPDGAEEALLPVFAPDAPSDPQKPVVRLRGPLKR